MALDKQIVPVVLQGGLSGKTDAKVGVPGRLLELQNARKLKNGRYDKRLGYDALTLSVSGQDDDLSGVLALSVFNDDLIAASDTKLYSWSPAADQWFEKSSITSVSAQNTPVLRNSAEQSEVDMATNQGVRVTAYTDSRGGVWATVSDESTGAFILNETQLNASGSKPTVRACGNYLYVFYLVGQSIRVCRLNPLAATAFDSEVSLVANVHATDQHYDVQESNNALVVAYNNTTPVVSVFYCTQVPAVGSPVSGFPAQVTLSEAAENCIDLTVAGSAFYIAYHNGTDGTRVTALFDDLTEKYAPDDLDTTTSPVTQNITGVYNEDEGEIFYFYEINAASDINIYLKSGSIATADGTVTAGSVLLRSVGLASKAFVYNGFAYATAVYDSDLQGTAFLIREDGFINAKFNAGTAGGLVTGRHLPQVLDTDTESEFKIPNLVKSAILAENSTLFTLRGIGLCTIDFGADSTFQNAQLGGNLHFATGILQAYDGFSAVEHGFHVYPEGITTAVQAGGSIDVGTRSYKVIYSWVDNQGQIHRSAPSIAVSATTTGGNQQVELTIPTLRLTARKGVRTNVTIEVYGTETTGTVYYKLTSTASPLYNDPTADTVTFVDDEADADIIGNEILYTTGSILDNIAPPSATLITVFKNRLVLAGTGDNTFWLSKPFTPGEAVAFSDELVYPIDSTGGDCTAVGVLDDKLILFRETSAYFYSGNGPNNAGQGSDFNGPIKLQMDVGCPYPNSVVSTPEGLMFKSNKGIYLLDSSGKPQYVGADVEDYNDYTIQSAVLVEDANEVRFSTTEGVTLVYNYYFKEWFTHHRLASHDAVNWQGVYTLLRTDSTVWSEADHYKDNGQHIPLGIGSNWISAAGVQGYQRVYRLLGIGDYRSQHQLRISIAYDFEPYYTQVTYLDTDDSQLIDENLYGEQSPYGEGNYGGNGSAVYQFRCHLKRQKCQSFRFFIEDVPTSDPGEAYSFTGFALQLGIKRGAAKLPARKSL